MFMLFVPDSLSALALHGSLCPVLFDMAHLLLWFWAFSDCPGLQNNPAAEASWTQLSHEFSSSFINFNVHPS